MENFNIGHNGENEETDKQISQENPLSLTQYKSPSLQSIHVPRLRLLSVIVSEKSLTRNLKLTYMEREE